MTIQEIKEILNLLMESGVAEIEVERGENRVWIKRAPAQETQVTFSSAAPVGAVPVPGPDVLAAAGNPVAPPEEKLGVVTSPIVGTFYESPSPGTPAFIKAGDTMQPGQVLCIIESMKLMNEIEAEQSGVIVSKLVANGKPVEYGEALFTYRPL